MQTQLKLFTAKSGENILCDIHSLYYSNINGLLYVFSFLTHKIVNNFFLTFFRILLPSPFIPSYVSCLSGISPKLLSGRHS